jgi:amino acid adenylation domain-containing protein
MSTKAVYVLPSSYAQQRLYLACQMDQSSSAYNIVKVFRLKGELDLKALERSLNEVIRRHEALRTSFAEEGGELKQVIRESAELKISLERLVDGTLDERRRQAELIAIQEVGREFDLTKWPLLRVRLLRVSEAEHVLILVLHHIISDGWSMGILMRELGGLYEMSRRGEMVELEEPEVQYADYAVWQREWLEGGELERQMGYWREQLKGAPPVLELASDYARGRGWSKRGRSERLRVGEVATRRLKEVSRVAGATMYMSLLGAFEVLLWRYSGQEDVVVGTPIANRSRAEVEGLIGFFVNTLVMRGKVSGGMSYREVVRGVKEAALGAYANQDVPFEKLVEEMQPDRDFSHSPIFQVMFSVHNPSADVLELDGLEVEALVSEYETSKYDLTVSLGEHDGVLEGAIRYSTDLFREDTIKRMARRLERLIASVGESPDTSLAQLDLIGPHEIHHMLNEWNDTRADYSTSLLTHQLFELQAARNPDAIAVSATSGALTYGELDRRANRLAHFLRGKGVGAERVVGICMERSPDLITCELAVLKAGGAYLPIDPAYPQERIAYLLASSHAPLLLTRQSLGASLPSVTAEAVAVDTIQDDLHYQSSESPRVEVAPENLAYVIYTSGSTGRPKGVGVPHGALLNLLHWHGLTYPFTAADRATLLAGVSFDAAVWEIWPYLVSGASLHIPDEQVRSDIGRLIDWINESAITKAFMPTPMAELALAQPWPEAGSLEYLFTGGEKLHWPGGWQYPFRLANHYGPTESTVIATFAQVSGNGRNLSSPSIGRPISNTQVYVLDRSLCPVPVGAKGELYIGGLSLARAYLDQPDLTADRFIPNPYAGQKGERLYRTGDVVRHLSDGDLEFWGRSDAQIKIRGYRIEPGEIEAALLDYAGVKAAAVTVYDPPDGQKQLVAYVVGRTPSVRLDRDDLKNHLRERLPAYMVPAHFVSLEAFPLTANGKLDKQRLPAPQAEGDARGDELFMSPIEEKLAGIWAEIMRLKRVGRHDNFFDIGGHSLAAMQLVAKVREHFSVELNIRHVFEAPTIPGLADMIAKKNGEGDGKHMTKISRISGRRVLSKLEPAPDEDAEHLLGDRR